MPLIFTDGDLDLRLIEAYSKRSDGGLPKIG